MFLHLFQNVYMPAYETIHRYMYIYVYVDIPVHVRIRTNRSQEMYACLFIQRHTSSGRRPYVNPSPESRINMSHSLLLVSSVITVIILPK